MGIFPQVGVKLKNIWNHHLFPERRFVAGFFRRLLAYLTPHISHTYPSHHTYPTHIHSKRIPSIRIPPIRIRSTRIPPIRIHAMRIHSMRIHAKGLHQQEWQCMWMQNISLHVIASAGMAMYVNAKHILAYHWSAGMAMSMSIIACHFIPLLLGGNGNENRNLAFPSIFFATLLIEYNCIARVWAWNSSLAIGLLACRLLIILLLYSAGRDGEGQPEINPFAKNASSIAQNCSETQISFARGQPFR